MAKEIPNFGQIKIACSGKQTIVTLLERDILTLQYISPLLINISISRSLRIYKEKNKWKT
jgi:hypothetical protein